MSSQLFAFRLAKPAKVYAEDAVGVYDPVSQTSTWEGGSPALAASCVSTSQSIRCYFYGSYCSHSAGTFHKRCD